MRKTNKKNWILTKIFAVVMVFGLMLCLTACGNENFECAGKTFVYDNWEATAELSEAERLEISGLALGSYGNFEFAFDANGTFVCRNSESGENTFEGTWEIVDQH